VTRIALAFSLALMVLGCRVGAPPAADGGRVGDTGLRDAISSDVPSLVDVLGPDALGSDASVIDAPVTDAAASDVGMDAFVSDVTTIRIVYPAGHAVSVRGSGAPLSWTTGTVATELGGGVYELTIHGLTAEIELKPLLDDTTFSRGPNYHVAPGQTIEISPHFAADRGRVSTLLSSWSSALLGNARVVYAYLPAAYDENTAAHFTVLYMHDGQNLFDASLAFGGNEWQVDETMDAAGERGRCPDASACNNDGDCGGARCETFADTIVIGVGNTAARIAEYTPTVDPTDGGGDGDLYLQALVEELRPQVDTMLRTRTAREDTAMMGSSLGGLISAHAGIVRPETFGLIGAMSPSTWWDGTELITEVSTIATRPVRALRVYVDSGDSGASMDDVVDTANLAMAYRSAGYVEGATLHYVVQAGGQHNEIYWAERLPAALPFLLPRRERVLP
jgi:predicted alpha/beta superfamily hydrolase